LKKTYHPNASLKDRCKNKETTEGYQALKGIDFVVEKGEVFGLLGHNGELGSLLSIFILNYPWWADDLHV